VAIDSGVSSAAADHPLRRVAVVGATGTGKSHLAQALAQRLRLPYVELDGLYWEPGWKPAARDVFRARVTEALAGQDWVADGNAHQARDIVWHRATALVWLDYALPLVLWRLARRTLFRLIAGELERHGNREPLGHAIFSRDSVLLWALQSHSRHRREYPVELARPENAHLTVVRLRSPSETDQWLANLS
jgi:adenylate kinase family enzyme